MRLKEFDHIIFPFDSIEVGKWHEESHDKTLILYIGQPYQHELIPGPYVQVILLYQELKLKEMIPTINHFGLLNLVGNNP